jgi:hypothetical protein
MYYTYTDLEGNSKQVPYNVATEKENIEQLQKLPFIIATCYYAATGEGNTLWLAAGRFKDENEMTEWLEDSHRIDRFYIQGFKFYINKLPPKEDTAYRMLTSEVMQNLWAGVLDGKIESGYYRFFCTDYTNFS